MLFQKNLNFLNFLNLVHSGLDFRYFFCWLHSVVVVAVVVVVIVFCSCSGWNTCLLLGVEYIVISI